MPSVSNLQPSLALTESIVTSGVFEGPGSGSGAGLAFMRIFAGYYGMQGQPLARGQLLPISQNTALFSLIGTYFGGDGKTTFALPDLRGRLAVGDGEGPGLTQIYHGDIFGSDDLYFGQSNLTYHSGGSSQPVDNEQPSLGMHYMIQVEGIFPSQGGSGGYGNAYIGDVALFAGNFSPEGGWMGCAGQLLPISEYEALFNLIGTTYGGDGQTTFALPDLRGRTIIGAGQGPGLANYVLGEQTGTPDVTISTTQTPVDMGGSGQPGSNIQPSLALNYVIALQGIFPSQDGSGYEDNEMPYIGEIMATAINFAPSGYALCAGQLLSIIQNQALFAILGTTYGGDGKTTFALPDLRGRAVIGTDDNHLLGEKTGSETYSLTSAFSSLTINDDDNGHTLFGGDANDLIMGNGGADRIDGGLNADSMYGGQGDDTFIVDNSGDLVFENSGEGTDTVLSGISYTLGAFVENLTLTGTQNHTGTGNGLDNVLTGNSGHNTLKGLGGADYLDGGGSSDTMFGGAGDDTYVVDAGTDTVREDTVSGVDDGGHDKVISSITYTLTAFVEDLDLTGSAVNGSGNDLGNHITGNAGNNSLLGYGGADTLDGSLGADRMYGGSGNDTYYVDNSGDRVIEDRTTGIDDGGTDLVISSVSFTLGDFIEDLTLSGSAINASGNNLDNHLTGNYEHNTLKGFGGNDVLDGGGSSDTMYGGAGDDTYYVDNATDKVREDTVSGVDDGGHDKVISSVTYTLTSFVEDLDLTGSAVNGSGNDLDNHINGNAGDNSLLGYGGNDVLDGGLGADRMYGGAGNDTYYVDNTNDKVIEDRTTGVDDGGTDLVISSVSFILGNFVENLTLTGATNAGGAGNSLNNIIIGNSGGNILTGNGGNDILTGGLGHDTFSFSAAASNGLDHLTDFVSGTDHLRFKGSDYGFATGHVLTSAELKVNATGAASGGAHQFIYNTTTHTLYWDSDGTGATAAIALAVFDNAATPATGDFLFT